VATKRTEKSTAFSDPIAPPAQRRADGKARRQSASRTSHGEWEPAADRPDPVELLVESNRTRQQDLVPLRYSRMAASPFAFLRGSALAMAVDLRHVPQTGLEVTICGDAHIANFGVFASPERRLVFDLNDFDEVTRGSFEWDVKRLAASITVAARERGLDAPAARRVVVEAVDTYRFRMDDYAAMSRLDLFYSRIDAEDLAHHLEGDARQRTETFLKRAGEKNHLRALAKLTTLVDGQWRIVEDPPLVQRLEGPHLRERLADVMAGYHASLPADRQALFEQYRFVDFARKVVGVGSVGTRCWMVLLQGPNGGPLFLQVKEAGQASAQQAVGARPRGHQGRRVVEGQRSLQAVSDVLLGWTTDPVDDTDYFIRQLWDAKGSFDTSVMRVAGFRAYVRACAWALARAHARTGDPATIAGYLGSADTFSTAMAEFAERYADQTERDHAALVAALADGRLPST
jgi:uncharacterized protein (DUF2252 family)